MKAVVLEKRNGLAAVLREDGVIEKVHISCEVGDTIDLPEKHFFSVKRAVKGAVASVAMALLLFTGSHHYLYSAPVSYVTLDAQPSIEFAVNRRGQVIGVEALNDEGKEIVKSYQSAASGTISVEKALEKTVDILCDKGYMKSEDNNISLNVASDNEDVVVDMSAHVKAAVERAVETNLQPGEALLITSTTASIADRNKAQAKGISTAQLMEEKSETKTIEVATNSSDSDTGSEKGNIVAANTDNSERTPQATGFATPSQATTGSNQSSLPITATVAGNTNPVRPASTVTASTPVSPGNQTATVSGTTENPASAVTNASTGVATGQAADAVTTVVPETETPEPTPVPVVTGSTGNSVEPTIISETPDTDEPEAPAEPVNTSGTGSGASTIISPSTGTSSETAPVTEEPKSNTNTSGIGSGAALIIGSAE